jgi:general L-amino acid transport system substrate-binding protein
MTTGVRPVLLLAIVAAAALLGNSAWARADSGVLEAARARGHVVCGVGDGPKGYSSANAQGTWSGIGVDFCRAVAAAAIGNKEAVQFRAIPANEALAILQSGEVDVLSGNLAMTSSRDTGLGVRFAGVLVYDGLGFMVRKSQSLTSALELSGARICVTRESADEQGLTDYFTTLKMPFDLVKFDSWPDAVMAYASKSCQVLSADLTVLALARQGLPDANEHAILPEIATKQPVGPAVRQGDEHWFSIVRWTLYALIAAEELGITSTNVDGGGKALGSAEARRFLGIDTEVGKRLGLGADWTHRIVKQVGNYGELFDRNLGQKSPLKLDRRLNNLVQLRLLIFRQAFY